MAAGSRTSLNKASYRSDGPVRGLGAGEARMPAAPVRPVMPAEARRAVVSYPGDLSDWSRRQLDTPWFRAYLRKTRADAAVGDEWTEFVDVGCCGSAHDVPLRLERLEGGDRIGPGTELVYTAREACGVLSGWRAQSAAGPTH